MSNPFINRRNTKNRRRGDSPSVNTTEGEFIRIADFDTFYWYTPSPGVGADRWDNIPNQTSGSNNPSTATQLVVGAMNPWNHSDASNYPSKGSIAPRTPTRVAIGFDMSGIPASASITQADLNLTVAQSREWNTESYDPSAIQQDIWIASWIPTGADAPHNTLAPESLGNVNQYEYVKPMIHMFDCAQDGGWEWSSPQSYITGFPSGCPNRFVATVQKMSELPTGKRCLRTTRLDQSPIFEEISDRYGYPETVTGLNSPWAENAGIRARYEFEVICDAFKSAGAIPDYITINSPPGEYISHGFWITPTTRFDGTSTPGWTDEFINNIVNDPRASQTWYGEKSFNDLYTNDGEYPLNFSNMYTRTYHPQYQNDYIRWNRAAIALNHRFMEEFVVKTIKGKFGNEQNICNGDVSKMTPENEAYTVDGHPMWIDAHNGNAGSLFLYGGWNFPNVYQVLNNDPTRLVWNDYAAANGGGVQFLDTVWNQFMVQIHKMRMAKRSSPNLPMRHWLSSIELSADDAQFGSRFGTEDRELFYELVRHASFMNLEMFNWWNTSEPDQNTRNANFERMNEVLADINQRIGGFRIHSLNTDRVNFLTRYIVSGCPTKPGSEHLYVWRFTPINSENNWTYSDASDPNSKNVVFDDGGRGAWIYTNAPTPPVFVEQDTNTIGGSGVI